MKIQVVCVTFNLLFFINFARSDSGVTVSAKYDDESGKTVHFIAKQPLQLTCNVSDSKAELKWLKDGVPINEVKSLKGRFQASGSGSQRTFKIQQATDTDSGNYTCAVYEGDKELTNAKITAVSKIGVKVPSSINVIEGEKLRIHCIVAGKPYPTISWYYANDTFNETYESSDGRVILERDNDKGIDNAILKIEEVQMYDRGIFKCIGRSSTDDKEVTSEVMIRIKDKYAALWPFLGICAEVFILCAIIFIYEKKRNKTELEESDTDQSPDQKNTPDNGKESNLRHRQ